MENDKTLLTAPTPKPKHTAKKRKETLFLILHRSTALEDRPEQCGENRDKPEDPQQPD